MSERPILFSGPMVRAILAGTKTQTRRELKLHPSAIGCCCGGTAAKWWSTDGERWHCGTCGGGGRLTRNDVEYVACPYGQPGDRLWVRETFAIVPRTAYARSEGGQQTLRPDDDHDAAIYREGWTRSNGGFKWRPSIHMPRWASRILLEIVSVRVERLNSIAVEDAEAEGCKAPPELVMELGCKASPTVFRQLWEQINGSDSWAANPWVWAIEFKRVLP